MCQAAVMAFSGNWRSYSAEQIWTVERFFRRSEQVSPDGEVCKTCPTSQSAAMGLECINLARKIARIFHSEMRITDRAESALYSCGLGSILIEEPVMVRLRGVLLIVSLSSAISYGAVPNAFRASTLKSHAGFNWIVEQSNHYDFYFESASPAARDIVHIESVMESEYSHITALLEAGNAQFHTDVFIVDSRMRMKQLCGHESNGLSIGNVLLFVYGEVNALGAHEETHLLSQHLWGAPQGIWITEGLAVYSENEWRGYQLHSICKRLKARNQLVPLATLFNDHKFNQISEMVTYPESGSFTQFLYERYGLASVRALWKKGAKALPAVTGKSLETIESEWLGVVDESSEATGYGNW